MYRENALDKDNTIVPEKKISEKNNQSEKNDIRVDRFNLNLNSLQIESIDVIFEVCDTYENCYVHSVDKKLNDICVGIKVGECNVGKYGYFLISEKGIITPSSSDFVPHRWKDVSEITRRIAQKLYLKMKDK